MAGNISGQMGCWLPDLEAMHTEWAAVSPRPAQTSRARRAFIAFISLLLASVALVALLGDGNAKTVLEGYAVAPAEVTSLAPPAKADEAAWKKTVVGLFGTWKTAVSRGGTDVDMEDPSLKDAYRGGGGPRVGKYHTSYRAPADKYLKGKLLPSAAKTEREWKQQVAAMRDGTLSQNRAILNSVGANKLQGEKPSLPPWKPTAMLKLPKGGEFKQSMRAESFQQSEHSLAAWDTEVSPAPTAAFLGLQDGLQSPTGSTLPSSMATSP